MHGVEVAAMRKIIITTAVVSMFRFSPGVDIARAANNEVRMVTNNYKNEINLTLPAKGISATSAIAAVRGTLPENVQLISKAGEAVLIVWKDKLGEYHVAYRVYVTTENPSGNWEAFVEAASGKVLHIESRLANQSPHQQMSLQR